MKRERYREREKARKRIEVYKKKGEAEKIRWNRKR